MVEVEQGIEEGEVEQGIEEEEVEQGIEEEEEVEQSIGKVELVVVEVEVGLVVADT